MPADPGSADPWMNPLFLHSNRGGRQPLFALLRALGNGTLLVPHYQRQRVWTPEQQARWVGHVLSQAPCPAVCIRQVDGPDGFLDEIVDGQQRLEACRAWLAGEVDAVLWTGERVWCTEREHEVRLTLQAFPVITMPPRTTTAEAMEMYLALNTAGTPHTAEELDRVRVMLREAADGE